MRNLKSKYRKLKRKIPQFALTIISILFFVIVAEVVCRLFVDESKFVINVDNENAELDEYYIDEESGLYFLNDGSISERYFLSQKGSGENRIAVIGDSYTFGAGVDNPDDTYVSQLSSLLSDDYEVVSFGDGGLNTLQEYTILDELALSYEPDMVILQYCTNDADGARTYLMDDHGSLKFVNTKTNYIVTSDFKQLVPSLPIFSEGVNRWLLKSSFIKFLSYRINTMILSASESQNIEISMESIRKMHSLLSERNIPFIIVNFPMAMRDNDFCNHITVERLSALTEELGIEYYDLCDYLDLTKVKSEIEGPNEGGHYNKKGNYQAAKIIQEAIEEVFE